MCLQHLKKGYSSHGNRTKSLSESWTTSKGSVMCVMCGHYLLLLVIVGRIDLYGEQSGVKVEIGDGQQTEVGCPDHLQLFVMR